MKMMKKSFVRRVVLLLVFSLLFTVAVAIGISAGDSVPTITFHFDSDQCTVILESPAIPNEDHQQEMKSGVPVEIQNQAEVKVYVVPKFGYDLIDIVNADNSTQSLLQTVEQDDGTTQYFYYNPKFAYSVRANVTLSQSVFSIKYEKGAGIPYEPVSGGGLNELNSLTHRHLQENTKLPEVKRFGYKFEGWYIYSGDTMLSLPKDTTDSQNQYYYIPKDFVTPEMVVKVANKDVIYLHAEFTPVLQPIIRYDHVVYDLETFNRDKELGRYEWSAAADAEFSALTQWGDDKRSDDPNNPDIIYKAYSGYKLLVLPVNQEGSPYKSSSINVQTNPPKIPEANVFYRLYTPIVYALEYRNLEDGTFETNPPQTYTYDLYTPIPNPTRRGYVFAGWKVTVDEDEKTVGVDFALGNQGANNADYAAKNEKIILTAQWQPITYFIDYEWGEGVDDELETQLNNTNTLPGSFVFDSGVMEIINPKRPGYTFTGWIRNYVDGEGNPQQEALSHADGKTMLDCSAYAHDITLTATWQAKTFDVVFGDVDGITNGGEYTNGIAGVVYDQPLTIPQGFIIPTKTGYTFAGYYAADGVTKYINADGTSNCNKWDIDSDSDTVTLYAKWEANPCNITVTIDGLPTDATVTIKVITADGTSKTVANGETIILPYDTVFHVEITELGKFRVVQFSSNGTNVTFSGEEAFVSNDITVDAEAVVLTAVVWPASPERDQDVVVSPTEKDTELKVTFKEHINASDYEVAISQKDDLTNEQIEALDWYQIAEGTNSYLFENLEAGTYYSVFIRVKATDHTYSGIIRKVRVFTEYNEHIESAKNDLASKLTNDDVTNCYANKVIEDALEEIRKKEAEWRENGSLPEDFQAQIDKLVNDAKAAFEVAQVKDSKLVEWRDLYFAYIASGSFDETRKVELLDISDRAEEAIRKATTKDDINKAFNDAKAEIEEVPVTYLYDANKVMQLESLLGLGQTSGITLTSIEDIRALRRAVADAIAQGNITADSFITIEEATNLLRALDVVSAYSFNLINVQMSEGDVFTLRMTIPESLINCTGLQVAYFNQATGVLELLETKQEGNTLVFKAKQITDFVILADPTVDLTAVIIALGAILLCQLIAIAFVLISRNKAKNSVMHASVALPLFLTIHFLPVANAELIALGLGAAVLLAQIVLMWLLLSSGMIRVFKTKKTAPQKKEVTAVVREEDLHEDPYAAFDEEPSNEEPVEEPVEEDLVEEETATEESPKEEPEEVLDEDAFDEELAEELAREQDEVAEAEEVYDDEEFIEHAPNPYYSLDEEENEYAFDEEEAERVSDVDTTDQEAEETSLSDDPVDGVFGETDVQYGDAGDEGRRSSDEDSYAESYEYGDEADASYAETEVADREETSSEGSVDPASYIVNDDEDLSDEEEMYRYDE